MNPPPVFLRRRGRKLASFQQWSRKSCTILVFIRKLLNIAPKSIDHSLHLLVLVSAIFRISPYLGNAYSQLQLLQPKTSILRIFHESPTVIFLTCIVGGGAAAAT